MNTSDLRELLRQQDTVPPPVRPDRQDGIEARVRKIRRRRMAGTGVALVSGAAIVLAVLTVVPGGEAASPERVRPAATPATKQIPETFTEPDGTTFRRIGTAKIDAPKTTKASVTVPLTGKPLAIFGECKGPRAGDVWMASSHDSADSEERGTILSTKVRGAKFAGDLMSGIGCDNGMMERAEDVRLRSTGARQVTLEFEVLNQVLSANGQVPATKQGKWTIGVYEWTPPAQPRNAPPAPVFPKVANDAPEEIEPHDIPYNQVAVQSGTWPDKREVSFTVPYRGRELMIMAACEGAIADRVKPWVRLENESSFNVKPDPCEKWSTTQKYPLDASVGAVDKVARPGTKVTIRVELSPPSPEYETRSGSWTIGVYEKSR